MARCIFSLAATVSLGVVLLAAQNVYSMSLGVCAVALENAMEGAGVRADPKDRSQPGAIRSLVRLMRVAFAHDLMHPRWLVDRRYKDTLEWDLGGRRHKIDLARINGKSLELEDIGGMLSYLAIKNEVACIVGP
ncbi:MAG: hypothetical protein ABI408_08450 [Gemmatimonadaceae bacterium]